MSADRRYGVRIPRDIEREDRVLAGLTARQVAILAGTGLVLWLIFMAVRHVVPVAVFLIACVPVIAIAAGVALGRRDGLSLDRLVLAALRQARAPHRLVTAPDGVTAAPAWVAAEGGPLPAPLRLPARGIRTDGVVDLGEDGAAVIVACSTVSFALATPPEQEAMVGVFARWLHSLTSPAQILVRAERVDLVPAIAALEESAPALPHSALEEAALAHAAYLTELAISRDLLFRQVLLVVREPLHRTDAQLTASRALRRAEEAARALSAAGINAAVLEGPQAAAVLADACDPYAPAASGTTDAVITRRAQ